MMLDVPAGKVFEEHAVSTMSTIRCLSALSFWLSIHQTWMNSTACAWPSFRASSRTDTQDPSRVHLASIVPSHAWAMMVVCQGKTMDLMKGERSQSVRGPVPCQEEK